MTNIVARHLHAERHKKMELNSVVNIQLTVNNRYGISPQTGKNIRSNSITYTFSYMKITRAAAHHKKGQKQYTDCLNLGQLHTASKRTRRLKRATFFHASSFAALLCR